MNDTLSPIDLFNVAVSTGIGSDAHRVAEMIALSRNGAPYAPTQTAFGMVPHWQAIVFETLLARLI